jgi:hypothetical protein
MLERRLRRSRLQPPRRSPGREISAPSRGRGAPPVGERTTAVGNEAGCARSAAPIPGAMSVRHGARNASKAPPEISGGESKEEEEKGSQS